MNYNNLTPEQQAQFADNVATLLGGTQLTAIDPAVRADLQTAIGTLPSSLTSADADAFVQAAEAVAATAARNYIADQLALVIKNTRDFLIAGNATKQQFDLC